MNASDGSTTTTINASGVSLSLGATDAGPAVIAVQNGAGSLTISSAGIVGSLTAAISTTPDGFTLGGTLSIAIDTTLAAPFVHIEATTPLSPPAARRSAATSPSTAPATPKATASSASPSRTSRSRSAAARSG